MDGGNVIADLLWCEQCHLHCNPSSLGSTKGKDLALDTECINDLQVHDCTIPVGEMETLGSGLSMTEGLNCNQIDCVRELLVLELLLE